MKMKILVCCHKDDVRISKDPYLPIQVGKALHKDMNLGIQGDDIGDNISCKNDTYCELTGIYWAWKNLKDVDAIGICHYRRYFDFHNQCRWGLPDDNFESKEINSLDFTIKKSIYDDVLNNTIILPRKRTLGMTLAMQYCLIHNSSDLRLLEEIIKTRFENNYYESFKRIFYGNNKIHPYNMFIMSWTNFNKYCNWLFKILFLVEERIDLSNYDDYQKRIFGFMAERLLNVYIDAEGIPFKQYPVISFSNENRFSGIKLKIINGVKNLTVFFIKMMYYNK